LNYYQLLYALLSFRPLQIAVRHKLQGIIKILIEKGALLNGVDASGKTALHIAVENKDTESTTVLINGGGISTLVIMIIFLF
jgi:ankyrin repeat protein